jgi:hypothetical protein
VGTVQIGSKSEGVVFAWYLYQKSAASPNVLASRNESLCSESVPNYTEVDETVTRVNCQRHWLFAAVDPDTNRLLHVRLFSTIKR